jgi:hypothetical protein
MQDDQRHARIFGGLYLLTFITSIPALVLYDRRLGPIRTDRQGGMK